jgi:hypothetical protein
VGSQQFVDTRDDAEVTQITEFIVGLRLVLQVRAAELPIPDGIQFGRVLLILSSRKAIEKNGMLPGVIESRQRFGRVQKV